MTKVRFHPQAWVSDYAAEVDPEGETEWEAGVVPDDVLDDDYASDNLRLHLNAPKWAREWAGPFWIEILRQEAGQ